MFACMHVCSHIHRNRHTHVHTYIFIHVVDNVCVCCVFSYIHICVCMCLHHDSLNIVLFMTMFTGTVYSSLNCKLYMNTDNMKYVTADSVVKYEYCIEERETQ